MNDFELLENLQLTGMSVAAGAVQLNDATAVDVLCNYQTLKIFC